MSITWNTVRGKGSSPVQGNPEEFGEVAATFHEIQTQVRELYAEFGRVANGDLSYFRGEAAEAFIKQLKSIAISMGDVPNIARQIEQIFRDHETQLVQLRQSAKDALELAQTRWVNRETAVSNHATKRRRLRSIEAQLQSLAPSNSLAGAAERERLCSRHAAATDSLEDATNDLRNADELLDESRGDWTNSTKTRYR